MIMDRELILSVSKQNEIVKIDEMRFFFVNFVYILVLFVKLLLFVTLLYVNE